MGGVPGLEAHGGYTFCALAALVILKGQHQLNIKALLVSTQPVGSHLGQAEKCQS